MNKFLHGLEFLNHFYKLYICSDEKEIEATLKFVIPLRPRNPGDLSPKGARADFALKVKGGIANPLHYHSFGIRRPNYRSKFAPGTYMLSSSAKITHHGSVYNR